MITIKKYANRRLYDTEKSAYITLAELAEMVRRGVDIEVIDAKSSEDLTRLTLIQVIQDIESEGHQMLPIDALRQIIMAYGGPNEPLLSRYLERTLAAFAKHHQQVDQALNSRLDQISQEAGKPAEQNHDDGQTQYIDIKNELDALRARLDQLQPN